MTDTYNVVVTVPRPDDEGCDIIATCSRGFADEVEAREFAGINHGCGYLVDSHYIHQVATDPE